MPVGSRDRSWVSLDRGGRLPGGIGFGDLSIRLIQYFDEECSGICGLSVCFGRPGGTAEYRLEVVPEARKWAAVIAL